MRSVSMLSITHATIKCAFCAFAGMTDVKLNSKGMTPKLIGTKYIINRDDASREGNLIIEV